MACGSCSSSGGCSTAKTPDGCRSNGGCSSGGCNKLNVFDWLGNMSLPNEYKLNIVEVRFKGGRKEFYRNVKYLDLYAGDPVMVDTGSGHQMGHVSLQGELVRLQMLKKKVKDDGEILEIVRSATPKDVEKHKEAEAREFPTLFRAREIIREISLDMKLSDVEYQTDATKATFFYSADHRVDFRELIRMLAGEFKVRVEMRQISLRQEASRIGGLGSCGRELCCSTWLTDFKSVSTSAARYQNLSLNPTKLSGQCGRLKCCLNYEMETYMDALIDIPEINEPLKTAKGRAFLQKTDIFKKIMWFSYEGQNTWHAVPVKRVSEILQALKKGESIEALNDKETVNPISTANQEVSIDIERLESKIKQNEQKNRPQRAKTLPLSGDAKQQQQQPQKKKNKPKPKNKPNVPPTGDAPTSLPAGLPDSLPNKQIPPKSKVNLQGPQPQNKSMPKKGGMGNRKKP